MIRHILKIIWNERKSNILIFLEFILVFCVFWFCCDYLYYIGSRYFEPKGYDLSHTYIIEMNKNEDIVEHPDDKYGNAAVLKGRLEKYPGVEAVSFSYAAIPYGWVTSTRGFYINNDSASYTIMFKNVIPEYFDVFRIPLVQGRFFNETEMTGNEKVCLISGDRYGFLRDSKNQGTPVKEIKELSRNLAESGYTVVGIAESQKRTTFQSFESAIYFPMPSSDFDCQAEIVIRVRPEADTDFAERFAREMKDQLTIGPYTLGSVSSLEEREKNSNQWTIGDNLKSILSISAFLIINIFLGIIGTFWSRIESRKSEIGLRLALGSTKRKVRLQMLTETMILLGIASIIGLYVCVNLGESELMQSLGIPLADYNQAGFGSGHYIVNYLITLALMVFISGLAVWYPARLASKVQPADTLRME